MSTWGRSSGSPSELPDLRVHFDRHVTREYLLWVAIDRRHFGIDPNGGPVYERRCGERP